MQKNIAGQKWICFAFDTTTGLPKTGDALNITANLRLDGGVANPVDDTNPAELEGGYYAFDLTDAETNGNMIVICPSSVTANIAVIGVPGAVWTESDFTATMKTSLNAATPAASNMRGTDGAITSLSGIATATNVTDAVTALATAHGAGSWLTATGFSTHSAADAGTDAASKVLATPARKIVTNAAGEVDANVQSINDKALTGDGSVATPWGPA